MTDQPTPTDDELSLALDGEADAALLARIDASPDAQARLEELRAATRLVSGSTVPPLAADTVDGLVGTALATPIAPSRGASTGRRAPTPWLVAAAVIVLMAVGLSLIWAGRGTEDDQASATRNTSDAPAQTTAENAADGAADSAFSDESTVAGGSGGHGSPTTVAPSSASSLAPTLFLGSYPDGAALRAATAASLGEAWKSSEKVLQYEANAEDGAPTSSRSIPAAPSDEALDRCAQQLRVTLALTTNPLQTGYATVDEAPVLVYEFAATSARDGKETTLVAAVGRDACDEVVIFER